MKVNTVSIVTPSFQQGEFIDETIRSVLGQQGNFFIDYIIMDGGSRDGSLDIIKTYATLLRGNCATRKIAGLNYYVNTKKEFLWNNCRGTSYRWRSGPDGGQVCALKAGFSMAQGDIFCWLNSDDIYCRPDVLQKVVDYFSAQPELALLFGDGIFISKTGERLGVHQVKRIDLQELLYLDYHILQPASFFRADIYCEKDLNSRLHCAFDADFFIRHLTKGVVYRKVDDRFAAFRYYPENKTISMSKRKCRESLMIARRYSKNRVYYIIAVFYRHAELWLRPFIHAEKGIKFRLFVAIRRLCYFLVTGKSTPRS